MLFEEGKLVIFQTGAFLPKYVIWQLSNFVKIFFEYHKELKGVKYWAI